jgi:hypothetical protein
MEDWEQLLRVLVADDAGFDGANRTLGWDQERFNKARTWLLEGNFA